MHGKSFKQDGDCRNHFKSSDEAKDFFQDFSCSINKPQKYYRWKGIAAPPLLKPHFMT